MKRKLAKTVVTAAMATLIAGSTVMTASAEEAGYGCYYYDYESGVMIWCGGSYDGAYTEGNYDNGYHDDGYHDDGYHDDGYNHDNNSHHEESTHHDSGSSHHDGSGHHSRHH